MFKNYRNAQNSYIADELKDYASNPNDVRYIGEKGPDDWYPNLIFNGGWFIRPTEGQVDENGKPYTKEDYIKATEWLPASIGFNSEMMRNTAEKYELLIHSREKRRMSNTRLSLIC